MRTALAGLTVSSLYAFTGLTAFYGFELSFAEIIRLLVIVFSLAWLVLVRDVESKWKNENLQLLYFLLYIFLLAQFHRLTDDGAWLAVAANGLLGIAFLSSAVNGGLTGVVVSRRDKVVVSSIVVGGLFFTASRSFSVGDISQLVTVDWPSLLLIGEAVLVYLLMLFVRQNPDTVKRGRGVLIAVCVSTGVAVLVGGGRVAVAYGYYSDAVNAFAVGRYDDMLHHTQQLMATEPGLQTGLLSAAQVLKTSMDTVPDGEGQAEAYAVIGDVAAYAGEWDRAVEAYNIAAIVAPDFPDINLKLADASFELGYRNKTLKEYSEAVKEAEVVPLQHWAYAAALARMGEWQKANRHVDTAFATDGNSGDIGELIGNQEYLSVDVRDLLSAKALAYLSRLTFYEIGALLRQRGWGVLHGSMQIGSTGIASPVDIIARSGLPGQEYLTVDGRQVSPQKRGYNIVVIHPHTGVVEDAVSFDTWENRIDGRKMGNYLRNIPSGKIVAATISDEGSGALVPRARAGLREVGVRRFPIYAWRHAFVGVKGTTGKAVESLGNRAITTIGILKGNIVAADAEDAGKLRNLLFQAAIEAPGKVAVYLPDLQADTVVTIARYKD